MIKLGQHKELAEALIKKRGRRSKRSAARAIGISVQTLAKLEDISGNTSLFSQYHARNWVNCINKV